jgi:sugar phosphate isomerase/epimerase
MRLPGGFHLTYCTNIHPGESWEEVRRNVVNFLPQVRTGLGEEVAFGIGLRLSAAAAEALDAPEEMQRFQAFLAEHNAYVFTINGFPYGPFHGTRVKEDVYLPDWLDEERLTYTNRLAQQLAALLPGDPGLEGSVSTVPGAFKERVHGPEDERRMASQMLRHAAELHRLRERTGKTITLALEPEPCCYIETVEEAIHFFREHLFAGPALAELAQALAVPPAEALAVARRHIGLCYDACHMAVEFEEVAASLQRLRDAGIRICKFQISSALKLQFQRGDGRPRALLSPFAESTYLHQTVARTRAGVVRYTDLPEAMAEDDRMAKAKPGEPVEWRVHFHVPIFLEEMRNFQTTQDSLVELLDYLRSDPVCPYLEVETYTWDVLPAEYRSLDLPSAIRRELAWVRDRIAP